MNQGHNEEQKKKQLLDSYNSYINAIDAGMSVFFAPHPTGNANYSWTQLKD